MPKPIGISCRLENSTDNKTIPGVTLVRVIDSQMIMVTGVPPSPGRYYLSIYVNDDWKAEVRGDLACSFQVISSEDSCERIFTDRFPEVGVLGSTPMAQPLGVSINTTVDPFVIWDERSTMKLNLTTNPGLRINHKFISFDKCGSSTMSCDNYALLQCHGQGRHQYHIRFPYDTFYCLTIYAGPMSSDNERDVESTEAMETIYRLLVDCRYAQDKIPPFPRQTSRWVGFKLIEPVSQYLELSRVYRFRILSLHCAGVTVVIDDSKWYDLVTIGEGLWKGKVHTGDDHHILSVYGKFENSVAGEDQFIKLLDYDLIRNDDK